MFYPHPGVFPDGLLLASSLLLLATITALAILWAKRWPFFVVGWLWYLGTLVPLIGLVQIAGHRVADRYADIPIIGVYIIVTWTALALATRFVVARCALPFAGVAVVLLLSVCSFVELGHWADSKSLYERALVVSPDNSMAHNNLGKLLADEGQSAEAILHYKSALEQQPFYPDALVNLGVAYTRLGDYDTALEYFDRGRRSSPGSYLIHQNLGTLSTRMGRLEDALCSYRQALALSPNSAITHCNLANTLQLLGRRNEALEHYERAVAFDADLASAHYGLGKALVQRGTVQRGVRHLELAVLLDPLSVDHLGQLEWVLATTKCQAVRDPRAALQLANAACQLSKYQHAGSLDALAAAHAAVGNFQDAKQRASQAVAVARSANQTKLATEIALRRQLYESGRPYTEHY